MVQRQCGHLKRIKKYLQDKTSKIDYQIRKPSGDKFIVLDPQFGSRYIINRSRWWWSSIVNRSGGHGTIFGDEYNVKLIMFFTYIIWFSDTNIYKTKLHR